MSKRRAIERVVDGQRFRITPEGRDRYHFDWVSGPNPNYGFSSQTSDRRPHTEATLDEAIRDFLDQVDPETGYID